MNNGNTVNVSGFSESFKCEALHLRDSLNHSNIIVTSNAYATCELQADNASPNEYLARQLLYFLNIRNTEDICSKNSGYDLFPDIAKQNR